MQAQQHRDTEPERCSNGDHGKTATQKSPNKAMPVDKKINSILKNSHQISHHNPHLKQYITVYLKKNKRSLGKKERHVI